VPDREHNGSSIPIPDGVAVRLVAFEPTTELHEMVEVADLPRLYEAWAESRLEAVTDAVYEAAKDGELSASPLSSHPRPDGDALAREALGLGDRSS
jgi:hypothetical protein